MSLTSPLRSLIRRQAVSKGFPDPIELLEKLGRFSEPSEVQYPVELLRAGATLHIRGLFNSAILQYNTDWKWPYWVNRQFDPTAPSFIPRAFSLTHINLTHRNWVGVGLPDYAAYPLVDPTGLLTPHWDSWSIEVWVQNAQGEWLTAEEAESVTQHLDFTEGLAVNTALQFPQYSVNLRVEATHDDERPLCRLNVSIDGAGCEAIAFAVRPANPEGVSFVYAIEKNKRSGGIDVDGVPIHFARPPDAWAFSDYRQGDVFHQLSGPPHEGSGRSCAHGMATAAVVFRRKDNAEAFSCTLPLSKPEQGGVHVHTATSSWPEAMSKACEFKIPDQKFQYLTDAAIHTLVLLSPGDVYPGSFTYKRFWFRDAAYMAYALLGAGLVDRAKRVLGNFVRRQLPSGYFRSQEGEWDSNGQVLWIFGQYFAVSGEQPNRELLENLIRGGQWIRDKRRGGKGHAHPGLLPAGFSAEHLGPNDYYYWDDFWSVSGLLALADLCEAAGETKHAREFRDEAHAFEQVIDQSLAKARDRNGRAAMPAAPLRRLDSAVIGSVVASYPLRLYAADDARLTDTVAYLMSDCLVQGVFYQEMIHSGLNAYLTLHLAQAALREGEGKHFALIKAIAELATPTGQWPEAIHPGTHGGCMGDGQHGWAAAEWLLMMRNLFIREEEGELLVGTGLPAEWLQNGEHLACHRTAIASGLISLDMNVEAEALTVTWSAQWHTPQTLHFRIPGFESQTHATSEGSVRLSRNTPCAS